MSGIKKNNNILEKDLINEASFEDSPRFQAFLSKIDKLIPPGVIIPWLGGYFTGPNNANFKTEKSYNLIELKSTKKFNEYYIIADGSTCNNPNSLFNKQIIPNITDDRFLCGAIDGSDIGNLGGSNTILNHKHILASGDTPLIDIIYSTSTSPVDDRRGTNHSHNSYISSSPGAANQGKHRFYAYNDGGSSGTMPTNAIITDDISYGSYQINTAGDHSHVKNGTSSDYNFIVPTHVHYYTINSFSCGSGNLVTDTDNRPKFLSTIFLFKVI